MLKTLLLVSEKPFRDRKLYETIVVCSFVLVALQGTHYFPIDRSEGGIAYALTMYAITTFMPFVNALAISRLRSRTAAYIFLGTLALTLLITTERLLGAPVVNTAFTLGLSATILDVVAASLIVSWLRRSPAVLAK